MAAVVIGAMQQSVLAAPSGHAERRSGIVRLQNAPGYTRAPAGWVQRAAPGYRVSDPAAYRNVKAQAARAIRAGDGTLAPSTVLAPAIGRSWQGPNDINTTPSDSTGAVGTTRYITLVNSMFAIYKRTSNVALDTGTLQQLAGVAGTESVFDPQVIWDPGTKRFYYAMDDVVSATNNRLAIGFSKTASPTTELDWCKYVFSYGALFPDYPKLGDSGKFMLIGVNTFDSTDTFLGSDLVWVTKPPAGSTCPDASTFVAGTQVALKDKNGSLTSTPVPANQTDTNATGWVVSNDVFGPVSSNFLTLFKVTQDPVTFAAIVGAPKKVNVAAYGTPPSAPQSGTTRLLDTLDARLTQAVSAVDPTRGTGGKLALWTSHTVSGGAGSQLRWYEIDPAAGTVFQSGNVSDPMLFVFNGAVAPDRVVRGSTRAYGASMGAGFTTSSSTTFSAIQTASHLFSAPAGAISAFVLVKQSPGFNRDFGCAAPPGSCRWGDYSAATPDPQAATGSDRGAVWLTNMWNVASTSNSNVDWRSWNWSITP
jgi:hypothetical protein